MNSLTGAKSDDPLSPDWVPSVFTYAPASRKKYKEREEPKKKKAEKKKNIEANRALLKWASVYEEEATPAAEWTSVPEDEETPAGEGSSSIPEDEPMPPAEDPRQWQNPTREEKLRRLGKECNKLKKEHESLKAIIESGTFDEFAFENQDARVKTLTGIPSYSKLQHVLTFLMSFLQNGTQLGPFQQLLLTLMRLKMYFSLSLLSCLFEVSVETAGGTFRNTIEVLHRRLVPALVFWPNREELQLSMPALFKRALGKCTCVIDCFDFIIETPKDFRTKAQTYSIYKGIHTIKYLIGLTPQGTVCFISKGWSGGTSNRHIIENCGLLERLKPGDVVLADRGFRVSALHCVYNNELHIQALSKGGNQLYPVELESTQGLLSARVQVRKVIIEAKKRYTLLRSTAGYEMCDTLHPKEIMPLDKIVHVCFALTNLSSSIVPLG